jgi:Leucine-rich repeat (LRR) protein
MTMLSEEDHAQKDEPLHEVFDADDDIEHSQLPAVEEYRTQVAAERARSTTTTPRSSYSSDRLFKKRTIMYSAFLIFIVILSIIIGVTVSKNKHKQTNSNASSALMSGSPTMRPNGRYSTKAQHILEMAVTLGWSDGSAVKDQSGPQTSAAVWLGDNDPMRLDPVDTEEFRQRYALAVFYYALKGEHWLYSNDLPFLSDKSVCDWSKVLPTVEGTIVPIGVECYGSNTTVKQIFLPFWGVSGQLPKEMGLLSGMDDIGLYGNDLTGHIPSFLPKMTALTNLDLHQNFLAGPIPSFFAQMRSLRTIDLSSNALVDQLPELSAWNNVHTLNLAYNALNDDINRLAPLSGIQNLIVANNSFFGVLSNDLQYHWPAMELMDISNNHIQGPLPANIFAMPHLEIIDLHGNKFNESLPVNVPPGSSLLFLALYNNEFSGSIDFIPTHMKSLAHLDLSGNAFTGTLPDTWDAMTNLRYLFLADNEHLTPGTIPISMTKLTKLVDLSLQNTVRTGRIPLSFDQNSEALTLLDLSRNKLSGQIPIEIGLCRGIRFLFLDRNELTGTIPAQMSGLNALQVLLLERNNLTAIADGVCTNLAAATGWHFISDCTEIACPTSCCTQCCTDMNSSQTVDTCNDAMWLGQRDPLGEYEYRRSVYRFGNNDIIFPVNTVSPTIGSVAPVSPPNVPTPKSPTVSVSPTRCIGSKCAFVPAMIPSTASAVPTRRTTSKPV